MYEVKLSGRQIFSTQHNRFSNLSRAENFLESIGRVLDIKGYTVRYADDRVEAVQTHSATGELQVIFTARIVEIETCE